ncbi:MAG: hypothetical protein WC325_12090 [Candidatus Bathyarchaeia archaeon]
MPKHQTPPIKQKPKPHDLIKESQEWHGIYTTSCKPHLPIQYWGQTNQ